MSQVIVELSGDERKILESYRKAREADKALRESTGQTAIAGVKASSEYATAWLKAGKESVASANMLLVEMRKNGPEGRKVAEELEKHFQRTGQHGRRSLESVIAKWREFDPAAADAALKVRQEMKLTADKSESAFAKFGSSAVGQITAIAASYGSIERAIQTVIDLNQKVIATNREAFESVKRQGDGDRKLLQVAGDDPKSFESLRTRADDLSMKYGVSREETRELVANAVRERFEGSVDSIAANAQVIDVGVQTQIASKVPAIFKDEGITAEQAINATFTAARQSSTSAEELGTALPIAAQGAAMAGASASETLAATAGISDQFNTPMESATRIRALAMKISLDAGNQGKTAEELAKLEKAENDRLERAQKNFRTLQERERDIKSQIADTKKQPQTDATEKRLATLQTRLERAERDVAEFDQKDLVKKAIKNDPTRESLKGKGLFGAVREMEAMTPEQRKSILGDDAESNIAYELISKNRPRLEADQVEIERQKQLTGTDQSAIAIKRAQSLTDPKMAATLDVARSEIKLEVERENKRAITEGDRQTRKNDALRAAETSGASPLRIAAAEIAGQTVEGFGVDAGLVIPALAGDSLANLQRDLSQDEFGGEQVQRALLAANQLQRRRQSDPEAILSTDETANYLSTTEKMVLPSEVTKAQQEKLTALIVEQANESAGLQRSVFTSLFNSVGIKNPDAAAAGQAAARNVAMGMSDAAVQQLAEQNRLMKENNGLLREQTQLLKQQSQASAETAANTKPRNNPRRDLNIIENARRQK